MKKQILICANPNDVGKAMFAQEFLPNEAKCSLFINADLIAAGLSPFAPELKAWQAGWIMLDQIIANIHTGKSFGTDLRLL